MRIAKYYSPHEPTGASPIPLGDSTGLEIPNPVKSSTPELHQPVAKVIYTDGEDLSVFALLGWPTYQTSLDYGARAIFDKDFYRKIKELKQETLDSITDHILRNRLEILIPYVLEGFDRDRFTPELMRYAMLDSLIDPSKGLVSDGQGPSEEEYSKLLLKILKKHSLKGDNIKHLIMNLRRILRARIIEAKERSDNTEALVRLKARQGEARLTNPWISLQNLTRATAAVLMLTITGIGTCALLPISAKKEDPTNQINASLAPNGKRLHQKNLAKDSNTERLIKVNHTKDGKINILPFLVNKSDLKSHEKDLRDGGLDEVSIKSIFKIINFILNSQDPKYIQGDDPDFKFAIGVLEQGGALFRGDSQHGYNVTASDEMLNDINQMIIKNGSEAEINAYIKSVTK